MYTSFPKSRLFSFGPYGKDGIVDGYTDAKWIDVRHAYEMNFQDNLEMGSQLVIYHKGELVVDLAGKSNRENSNYSFDTLQTIFSSGKNMECICVAKLVQQGLLSYDDKVSDYWPEFGQNKKQDITIADVMRHESGVPFFTNPNDMSNGKLDRRITVEQLMDPEKIFIDRLIEGSGCYRGVSGDEIRHYHSITRGWIVCGIVRRVDPKRRSLSRFMQEEICIPCGVSIHCGIPLDDSTEHTHKLDIARMYTPSPGFVACKELIPGRLGLAGHHRGPLAGLGTKNGQGLIKMQVERKHIARRHNIVKIKTLLPSYMNTPQGRALEIPSATMQSNARSLGKLAGMLANNGVLNSDSCSKKEVLSGSHSLLSPEIIEAMCANPIVRHDPLMDSTFSFTQGGVSNFNDFDSISSSLVADSFQQDFRQFEGWGGFGGSWFIFDRTRSVGLSYTMNGLALSSLGGCRSDRIMRAVQNVLKRL